MKFKVKGKPTLFEVCAYAIGIILAALFTVHHMNGQEKQNLPTKAEKPKYQTWKLPVYMQENLQWMLDDFNKRFDEKVQSYKKELQTRFAEFKDMPDDAVLYLEGGMFINRADFIKLQRYMRDIEEIRNKQKIEEKKDGK